MPRAGVFQVRDEGNPMREQEGTTEESNWKEEGNFKPFVAHLPQGVYQSLDTL